MQRSDVQLSADPDHGARCYLGVDVGGTFTDLVFYNDEGELLCVKVPSTPRSPGKSTLDGIDEIRSRTRMRDDVWASMHHTHSNTVATNALIERTGARLGMITTAGFRDIFEIQRLALPNPMRYDSRRPKPLVSREMVAEVPERMDVKGRVLQPLDVAAVKAAVAALVARQAEIIIVCFLHSYKNPTHERLAREIIEAEFPGVRVEASSDVWPQAREFERATLTAINAYVRPTVEAYVGQLRQGLAQRNIRTEPRGARSNGGMELLTTMARRPAVALLSGPAAGVAGATAAALEAGWREADFMTLDIGGTSADIGVVRNGRPVLSTEEHIADFPILIPTIAVSAIGAGGGSVIWLDQSSSLKVGPRSVGSDPGPACYGLSGSSVPALTDAFLLAGFLAPERKLGDKLALKVVPARQALTSVGAQIGWTADQVADGAIRIATAMMAAEATNVLARRGVDAPKFRMIAYGGAGPLLAALLAEEIYIDTILIPPSPGTLCAFGAARADVEGDFVYPVYAMLGDLGIDDFAQGVRVLSDGVEAWMATEAASLALTGSIVEFAADMRYDGQGFDVTVPLSAEALAGGDRTAIAKAFQVAHRNTYGHSSDTAAIWVKELRVHVTGLVAKPVAHIQGQRRDADQPEEFRTIRLRGSQVEARILPRALMQAGDRLEGPAIIDQMDTTTLVPDGWHAEVDRSGAIILTRVSRQ